MSHDDDLERLRLAQASRGSLPAAGPGLLPSRWAGRVVSSGGSLAAGKFALVQPQTVLGTEAEGQTAAWTDTGASQPVLMLGPGVPATGDKVLVRYSADRWVSKRRGSSRTLYPITSGCTCSAPSPLTVTADAACAGYDDYQSATLSYITSPSPFVPPYWSASGFWSNETFSDIFGGTWRYALSCRLGNIIGIYIMSMTGPFAGTNSLVAEYTIGSGGNTCEPFSLVSGAYYLARPSGCTLGITE